MNNKIECTLQDSADVKIACKKITPQIEFVIKKIIRAYKKGNKLLLCGNGGSAADAQHWAAEMINKFNFNRAPLPAIALHANSSNITSISNDYGFDYIFSKQIQALGNKGDILVIITTSDIENKKGGHSTNLYKAIEAAKKKNIYSIGLLSKKSKKIRQLVDYAIQIPASETPRIQEAHITIIHIICNLVENALFKK